MRKIEIGIALSRNSEKYLEFLLWTIQQTASDPGRFKYLLGVNHDASIKKIRAIASGHDADVFDANPGPGYGSANHGLALDIVFERMTAELGMILDCDVAFLEKNWDYHMELLLDRNAIVGTEYDGPKYLGFPNVICAMFKPDVLRKAGISFKPEGVWHTVNEETAQIYGRLPGDRILLDTGSELPRKLKAANEWGIPMRLHRANSPEAKFMTSGLRGEEYELDQVVYCTHLGRSYTREFGVNSDAKAWELAVRNWLSRSKESE